MTSVWPPRTPGIAPAGAPLGNLTDNCRTAGQGLCPEEEGRKARRRERRQLGRFLARMSTLPRVRHCGTRPVDQARAVMLKLAEKVAHFAGLQVCGSPWSCPVCAAKIAGARVTEVARAITKHEDQGGGVAHLIGTFSHHQGDKLATLLNAQQEAWRGLTKSRTWVRLKRGYGLEVIRFREITWGADNGWHPHFHAALLTTRALTEEERVTVEAELRAEWLRQLANVGLKGIGIRALRLEAWNGGQHLAEYLTKQGLPTIQVETANSLGLEVAGGAFKRGRADKGLTPWDLLALAAEGDSDAYRLWCEYEAATKGLRTNFWSRGLRARLLGTEEEPSDDEIASAEVGGQDVAGLWPEARRAVWAASPGGVDLLEACERSVTEALLYLTRHAPPGSWFIAKETDGQERPASAS